MLCTFVCVSLSLSRPRPRPRPRRQTRKDYITAKYVERRFVHKKSADAAGRLQALSEAVRTQNILSLMEVYAEGVDLSDIIPQANEHVGAPPSLWVHFSSSVTVCTHVLWPDEQYNLFIVKPVGNRAS